VENSGSSGLDDKYYGRQWLQDESILETKSAPFLCNKTWGIINILRIPVDPAGENTRKENYLQLNK
jgi:hypothetical protein